MKNRVHATLAKYCLQVEEASDAFSKKGRQELALCLTKLPTQTRYATELVLQQLDSVTVEIVALEERMKKVFKPNKEVDYLLSIPGVGFILAVSSFSAASNLMNSSKKEATMANSFKMIIVWRDGRM
jgi:transposase